MGRDLLLKNVSSVVACAIDSTNQQMSTLPRVELQLCSIAHIGNRWVKVHEVKSYETFFYDCGWRLRVASFE